MSSDSESDSVASGGVWPSSLTVGQTKDLVRFRLYVPPSAKLPRPWRISADGYPTLSPPTSRRNSGNTPAAGRPFPPSCSRACRPTCHAEASLPPKQAALHQDDDPAEMPGLLAVLAKSTEEAALVAAEEALHEKQVVAAVQQVVALEAAVEEDVWLLSSDKDGDGDGGDAAVIDLTRSDEEED
ncbi:hypothetical protein ZWY2020_048751 [Hordeum vulgare]|nr:hypothetical protein ZWY2020_048751 [Hordeum vulgare]